ncbi:cation efflux protein [Flammeovirgaceae bacterium 311]|nr:cation efflux protein [Flammeovirgaceae bacterium 311]
MLTSYPSLSAQEAERSIPYPVQISMANIPGLVELLSISCYGLSMDMVVLEDGFPMTEDPHLVVRH